jgi:hypothetical protein
VVCCSGGGAVRCCCGVVGFDAWQVRKKDGSLHVSRQVLTSTDIFWGRFNCLTDITRFLSVSSTARKNHKEMHTLALGPTLSVIGSPFQPALHSACEQAACDANAALSRDDSPYGARSAKHSDDNNSPQNKAQTGATHPKERIPCHCVRAIRRAPGRI